MAEQKYSHSSSLVRIPKSQLAAEQPLTRECWDPPKKDLPMSTVKGEATTRWQERHNQLKLSLIPATDSEKAQTKPYVHQDPGKGAVTPTRN